MFCFCLCFSFLRVNNCFWCLFAYLSVVVQLPSHDRLFATPWTSAYQASLFFTIPWSLLKFMSVELVMLSNHLVLCHPLLLFLLSVFTVIKFFSKESKHSRSLCNILYSIRFYCHHQTHPQLAVISTLAQPLHSFWS